MIRVDTDDHTDYDGKSDCKGCSGGYEKHDYLLVFDGLRN